MSGQNEIKKDNDKPRADCCGNCYFWKASVEVVEIGKRAGNCLRYPPVTFPMQVNRQVGFASAYPATQASEWCGEYKPLHKAGEWT